MTEAEKLHRLGLVTINESTARNLKGLIPVSSLLRVLENWSLSRLVYFGLRILGGEIPSWPRVHPRAV